VEHWEPGSFAGENIRAWRGWTWGIGRIGGWELEHRLTCRNPADASVEIIFSLDKFVPSRAVLAIHPHTGKFYACLSHSLYELDSQTVRQIFIGPITGTTYGGALAIGMDAQGALYTCAAPARTTSTARAASTSISTPTCCNRTCP
jgi:hypothetical protein